MSWAPRLRTILLGPTKCLASTWRQPGESIPEATPEVTPEVTPVGRLLAALTGELSRQSLQERLGLKDDDHFRTAYLQPALDADLIEMTVPDKPTSRLQKYRRTAKGAAKHAQSKE